jgi:hypothetical protein
MRATPSNKAPEREPKGSKKGKKMKRGKKATLQTPPSDALETDDEVGVSGPVATMVH